MKVFENIQRIVSELFNKKENSKKVFGDAKPSGWLADLKQIRKMISDSFAGKYKMSKRTMFIALGGLIYVISPLDFLPEFIPIIGVLDDIAIIAFVYKRLKSELDRYKSHTTFQDAEVIS